MTLLDALVAERCPGARRTRTGYSAHCPVEGHGRGRGDRSRSLSLTEAPDGRILIRCHAGCESPDVLAAWGATWADLYPDGGLGPGLELRRRRRGAPVRHVVVDFGLARDPAIPELAREAAARGVGWPIEQLARETGLSTQSLERLSVGYLVGDLAARADLPEGCWAYSFPMRLPEGPVCGIRIRAMSGRKWAVPGSANGLFVPEGIDLRRDRLIVCEGATDTAALLDMGLPAVGRPDSKSRLERCEDLARLNEAGQIVVLTDNDAAGLEGALRCVNVMSPHCDDVRLIQPPEGVKDARAWLAVGGARHDVEERIEAAASGLEASHG